MLRITNEIACRLESAEAIDAAGCAEAQCRIQINCKSAVKPVAGGVAVFCGVSAPLTHALGIGMHGPVSAHEMDELEAFFRERETAVVVDLCPHADPTLQDLLSQRGYRILEFVNVMARVPASAELPQIGPDIVVRKAEAGEDDLYVKTVIGGFFSRDILTEEELRLGATLFHMPCTAGYLAFFAGQAAGGGGMSIRNKVASLFGDATGLSFRGRGIHSALIGARVTAAEQAGCDLIAAGTLPGSDSQRNYQRLGFEVAYTKVTMILE